MRKFIIMIVCYVLLVQINLHSQNKLDEKYIVFFLTNTSIDQADRINMGKDANTNYTFVGELPQLFGETRKDNPYKYAFGLPGPMLLTQSIEQMQHQVNKAFDIAEKYNVPVYFQLDDCNNYTTDFGDGAETKFYNNPEWCEWVSFPASGEEWGGQSNGRLPYYWFNWGSWMHAEAFPSFQSPGFRDFVVSQLENGVLEPLLERYESLVSQGKEYLFAGLAVGWETHIPDYSSSNTILNVSTSNLPINSLAGDTMKVWEASKYGYNSLSELGYTSYNRNALYQVIHDYSELLAKTVYDAGIPRNKIFTHIVGFKSEYPNLETTFAPPIWTAVNDYSIPGFTLSPVTCPYDLPTLTSEINNADNGQNYFGAVEGYSRGVDGSYNEAYDYFESMFNSGATIVTVFGWGIEPSTSEFAVSHSPNSVFVNAAQVWLNQWEFTYNKEGWSASGDISGFEWQSGGYIGGSITGTDAFVLSDDNLNINIDERKFVTVRIQNSSPQTIGQIYFTTTEDGIWNNAKSVTFSLIPYSGFTTYTIDMSNVSGWKGRIKQLRVDPCNAIPGSSVSGSFKIDYVYIGNPKWEFTNNTDDWTAGNGISNFGWKPGGCIGGAITNYDAFMNSGDNLGIDISNVRYIVIRMKNLSAQTIGQVYFTTMSDQTWDNNKSKDFTISTDSNFVTYTIDMSGLPTWTGKLKQLRLDPCNAVPGSPVGGSFLVDFIHLENPKWEYISSTEGWTTSNGISSFGWQTGGYIGGTITNYDAQIYSSDNLGINVSAKPYVTVRLKNSSPQTIGQIYFTTVDDHNWNEAKHKDFTISTGSDFVIYTIDMSTVSGWTGELKQLRIDPCNAVPGSTISGSFQIDYIHISTADGSVYKTGNGIQGKASDNLEQNFRLSQNYPNPFNPSTRVEYSIPERNHVTLKVYDLLGREVANLVNEVQNPGAYSIEFDAANLSSGIYFYRIQAGDFTATRKMIILK